ncbi:MAG: hypothetical protein ACI90V_006351, partial [Bacillariaceae sp.]
KDFDILIKKTDLFQTGLVHFASVTTLVLKICAVGTKYYVDEIAGIDGDAIKFLSVLSQVELPLVCLN